jgi:hypothetical protein
MEIGIILPKIVLAIAEMLGLAITLYAGFLLYKSYKSATWPSVTGEVKELGLKDYSDSDGPAFSPEIRYEYLVDGKVHSGKNWHYRFGPLFSKKEKAQVYLNQYSIGMKIAIHYEPNKPESSVLETSLNTGTLAMFIIGIFISIFCALKFVSESR